MIDVSRNAAPLRSDEMSALAASLRTSVRGVFS
jgi:hypothetical protein